MKHLEVQAKNAAAEQTKQTEQTQAKTDAIAATIANTTSKLAITTSNGVVPGTAILPVYDPNHLLDTLMRHLGLFSDGALARRLKMTRSVLRKIREGTLPVCASMLLWMQEASGLDITELRHLMGDRRAKFRLGIAPRQRLAAAG